jgi:amylosucrase
MVQVWGALATRDTRLMTHVLATHFPERLTNATYATYLRCHDDIGWAVTDEDAAAVGLSGPAHRAFLSDFYEGVFPGSFAAGALFQVNEATGDKRISGSCAALAGLERAQAAGDAVAAETAVQRILMGHALIAAFGGIPLVYMGDELAMLNDWAYRERPDHAHDSRWLHRPAMDWAAAATRETAETPAARVFRGLRHILVRRRATPELHGAHPTQVVDTGNPSLFAIARRAPTGTLLGLFSFAETWQHLPAALVRAQGVQRLHDALSDAPVSLHNGTIALSPQARVWLV